MSNRVAAAATKTNLSMRLECQRLTEGLYLNNDIADVHFIFDSEDEIKKIPAHKIILANGSSVFMSMFYGALKEGREVKIIDASHSAFQVFLQFFYLAEVNLTMEDIADVINMLNKYNVYGGGLSICDNYLKATLTTDNIVFGVELGINFDRDDLKVMCAEKICKNPEKVFASNFFRECSKEALRFILTLDQLKCREITVFTACMEWAKFSCEKNGYVLSMKNRRDQLGDCFYLIQFGAMDTEDIFACVREYNQLFDRDELEELISIADPNCFPVLKIFENLSRQNVIFDWNERKVIQCARSYDDQNGYVLKNKEVVKFRCTKKLLFGGIAMKRLWLYKYSTKQFILTATMKIVEKSLFLHISDVILIERVVNINTNPSNDNHNFIGFDPIIIKPNQLYQIHLDFVQFGSSSYLSLGRNKSAEVIDGTILITFEANHANQFDGVVSHLYFNTI